MRPSLTARSARLGSLPSPSTIVAPRMTRSTIVYLCRVQRAIGRERRVIHQVADGGAHLHDLHGLLQAVDHRADHRDAAQPLHQARGNVRRVQARHHQHVGRAGQAAERIGLAQQLDSRAPCRPASRRHTRSRPSRRPGGGSPCGCGRCGRSRGCRSWRRRGRRRAARGPWCGRCRHLLGDGGELLGRGRLVDRGVGQEHRAVARHDDGIAHRHLVRARRRSRA